eukprot:gene5273-5939_t
MMPAGLSNTNKTDSNRQGFAYETPKKFTRQQLLELIYLEHTYSKPASLDPDFNRTHLTNVLPLLRADSKAKDEGSEEILGEIDVLGSSREDESPVGYDKISAVNQMSELEQCFQSLVKDESWQEDDALSRVGWTREQTKLYDQVLKVLSTYQLARCTYKGNENEEILRHVAISKAAKRFRYIASGLTWDPRAMSWLHTVLVDGLSPPLFLCYLELLQALIAKVPSLVEKMMQHSTPSEDKNAILNAAPIMNCLRKHWDPAPEITSKKKKKINPDSPIPSTNNKPLLLMLPRGPSLNMVHPKRFLFWQKQLSNVARTAPINVHSPERDADFACTAYLENIIGITRTRVSISYSKFPSRPVILIGWSVGSLLACQVSLLEPVAAIICLGYPCYGLDGLRQLDADHCIDVKCPVMFVIGTHSATCSTGYIEALREKMRVDTRLLVVPGGDEMLKLTSSHKKRVKLTQDMIDRLIMDDIEDFISSILVRQDKPKENHRSNTTSPGLQQLHVDKRKRKKTEIDKEPSEKKRRKQMLKAGMRGIQTSASSGNRAPSNLALTTSPALVSSLMSTNASNPDKIAISRHMAKNQQHGKGNEKMLKKVKASKKSMEFARSAPSQSHTGINAAQSFPATSSMLLSSSSAKVRLQDGRILCLQGSDSNLSSSADSQSFISTMPGSGRSVGNIQCGGASGFSANTHTSAQLTAMPGLGAYSTSSIACTDKQGGVKGPSPILSFSPGRQQQSTSFTGFANLASSSLSSTTTTTTTSLVDSRTAQSLSPMKGNRSAATNSMQMQKTAQLTSTDLRYLAKLFEKSNCNAAGVLKSNESSVTQGQTQEKHIGSSPISTKIGIGTLTNLPSSDGSSPGSGTRLSPCSKKLSSAKEPLPYTTSLDVPKMKALLAKNQAGGSKASSAVFHKRDLFDKNKVGNANHATATTAQAGVVNASSQCGGARDMKNLPVTVTIPTYNNSSRGFNVSANSKSQAAVKATTSVSSTLATGQQRLILSSTGHSQQTSAGKASAELSQLIRKVTPTSTGILEAVNSRQMSTSSSMLTVTGRTIQTSPLSSTMKNAQTITLHIPNTAMLKDSQGQLKKSGSEIKLIGVLNQKGKSPMSSPIHFSVQSKSAPASPRTQSSNVQNASKSEQQCASVQHATKSETLSSPVSDASDAIENNSNRKEGLEMPANNTIVDAVAGSKHVPTTTSISSKDNLPALKLAGNGLASTKPAAMTYKSDVKSAAITSAITKQSAANTSTTTKPGTSTSTKQAVNISIAIRPAANASIVSKSAAIISSATMPAANTAVATKTAANTSTGTKTASNTSTATKTASNTSTATKTASTTATKTASATATKTAAKSPAVESVALSANTNKAIASTNSATRPAKSVSTISKPATSTSMAVKHAGNSLTATKDAKVDTSVKVQKQTMKSNTPVTVQAALVQSLATTTLSAKQQESISNWLKSSETKKIRGIGVNTTAANATGFATKTTGQGKTDAKAVGKQVASQSSVNGHGNKPVSRVASGIVNKGTGGDRLLAKQTPVLGRERGDNSQQQKQVKEINNSTGKSASRINERGLPLRNKTGGASSSNFSSNNDATVVLRSRKIQREDVSDAVDDSGEDDSDEDNSGEDESSEDDDDGEYTPCAKKRRTRNVPYSAKDMKGTSNAQTTEE